MVELVVIAHIASGLCAVAAGITAMLSPKRPGRHPVAGRVYLWALAALFATGCLLALARPHTLFLLIPGTGALAAAAIGFAARRLRWRHWLPHHIIAMGGSYILALTAFYVDNGPRLPIWRELPPLSFWFLPAAVGIPLIWRALRRRTRRPIGEPNP
ncbi:DUF2306 domain-containing protein [Glycomyces dulcitolivorans]|uniref:DUF2306 domain-containing protein n=1 Tax=Glycomyces dulcitolivorans TaxID=2200759 RepID=UPI000DD43169|nr:DUF2306 domain-containing protein [Glycomyces dulcitolivorans]